MLLRGVHILHALILSLLASIILASNILAFLGMYSSLAIVILSFVFTVTIFAVYWHWGRDWRDSIKSQSANHSALNVAEPAWFDVSILVVASIFLCVVFLYRLTIYPLSPIGDVVSADLIGYHGVKAYDLVSSGTLWNLNIIYGQYPIGYESLLSIGIVLNIGIEIAGFMQAILLVWLITTLILLIRRYTKFPVSSIMMLVIASFFVPQFYSFILLVGKNDLLLSITILSALLHAPMSWQDGDVNFHPLGMALVTMMSLAIKASGLFILVVLWLLVLWQWWQAYRRDGRQGAFAFLHPVMFGASLLVMFPGGLWVLRNYFMMGSLFSPEISGFFIGSIANNLTNPDLYNSGEESIMLIGLMLIQGIVLLGLLFRSHWRSFALVLGAMVLAFVTAPLGAFHRPERDVLHVEWRYTAHSLIFVAIVVFAFVSPRLSGLVSYIWHRQWGLAIIATSFTVGCIAIALTLDVGDINALNPDNARVLRDVATSTSMTGGDYVSVYDFVQHEIHDAVIGYGSAQPLFLYDEAATNTVYAGPRYPLGLPSAHVESIPDYLVQANTELWGDDPFRWQPYFAQFDWQEIYRDETGILWQRISDGA